MNKKASTPACYPHPFSATYWKTAAQEFTNLRSLTFAALLCAAAIVIEIFQIPIAPPSLYISLSFLVISLCSMLTGPLLAIPCGLIVDIVGAMISGVSFFPGYTLTAVLTAIVYALFLYRARLSFARVALSKLCINLFINTLLGSLWRVIISGGFSYSYYVALSGIKNMILLPLEVFLICTLFRALQKPLQQSGIATPEMEIQYRRRNLVLLSLFALIGAILLFLFATHYSDLKAFLQRTF